MDINMEKYKFKYRPSAFELWKLSMYGIMKSMIGVTNIAILAVMLFSTINLWDRLNIIFKIILIIAIFLFIVWIGYTR